jgi:hypothetical protein
MNISQRGNLIRRCRSLISTIMQATLTKKLISNARKLPMMIRVEVRTGVANHEVYCMIKVARKHRLQMNATREKNNSFRIPQLGVKLRYFAHY